ncbi:unnamed protein product [Cylicostephanus goldi]|uniref:Uncharacterized protein n=1 Tax=Cylicostephanus goldi TaxID=71465 RepID=A0A3P6TCF7_CYLGO|nr:unnamed protein product [Cylicostephanus goldi]
MCKRHARFWSHFRSNITVHRNLVFGKAEELEELAVDAQILSLTLSLSEHDYNTTMQEEESIRKQCDDIIRVKPDLVFTERVFLILLPCMENRLSIVTFGKIFEKYLYNRALDAYALRLDDTDELLTETGENGINLSGGHGIALASIRGQLFSSPIGNEFEETRPVYLATNELAFLKHPTLVTVMKNGFEEWNGSTRGILPRIDAVWKIHSPCWRNVKGNMNQEKEEMKD